MKRVYPFWLKERHNPQLGIYYVAMGQMSKTAAKRYERPGYGVNIMRGYDSEAQYLQEIKNLKEAGEKVQ